jgi:hypothetical protein
MPIYRRRDDMALDLNVDVGSVFTGIGTLAKDLRSAFTGEISPEKKAEIELKLLELESLGQQGQIAINTEEAKTGKGGWRQMAGYVCVIGFAYNFLAYPILTWVSINFKILPPPNIDATIMMNLLFGMLGLGGIKSLDLMKGTRK